MIFSSASYIEQFMKNAIVYLFRLKKAIDFQKIKKLLEVKNSTNTVTEGT